MQIICGDALRLMNDVPSNSIELVITSVPYNLNKPYDIYNDCLPVEEYHIWLRKACESIYRVIKPNCNIFINICDVGVSNKDACGKHKIGNRGNFYVIPHHTVIINEMTRLNAQYLNPIIWKKPSNCNSQFGGNARFCGSYPYPRNLHVPSEIEYILHFRKNGEWKKVPKEIKEASRVSKERWKELSSQIWEFNGNTNNKDHPAQFPIELPLRCVEGWSFVNDMVLDPFMGLGNTAIACQLKNRNFIGFDLSENYCNKARERLDAHKKT